jgi:uncharacterized membrane protein
MADAHPHHLATFEVLMFSFDGMETARDTVTDLKAEHKLTDTHILADAIIAHAPTGKIHMHETGGALLGGGIGVVGGGMVAMFAGPVALPFLMAAGALLGGMAGHMAGRLLPAADLREVAHALPLNSSAYLVLVEHDDARRLEEIFTEREARIVSTHVDSEMAGVLGQALSEKLAARAADAPAEAAGATAQPA